MTADILNRIGLALGLLSGLLLTPEVINLIPIEHFEQGIRKFLDSITRLTKSPLDFHPPSWKRLFSEKQRATIELITAILAVLFSFAWITTIVTGIVLSSRFFVFLGITILFAGILRNMKRFPVYVLRSSGVNIVAIFLYALFIIAVIVPPLSLLRVALLLLQFIVIKVKNRFSKNNALRSLFIALAITAFILSNILQFAATFYD